MKNSFLKFPLIAIILFSFSSCQDDFEYPNTYTVYIDGIQYSGDRINFNDGDAGTVHIHLGRTTETGYSLQFGSHDFTGTGSYNDDYFHLWVYDNYYNASDPYDLTITEYKSGKYIRGTFAGIVKNTDDNNDQISVSGDFSFSTD